MYEFYQVDGFSAHWRPNKFEFHKDSTQGNGNVVAAPSWSCFDPENDFPQTQSAILAYNSSKTVPCYRDHYRSCSNYKALSIQK
jgi:hypothetical protein